VRNGIGFGRVFGASLNAAGLVAEIERDVVDLVTGVQAFQGFECADVAALGSGMQEV
jgi:hypothetical protein